MTDIDAISKTLAGIVSEYPSDLRSGQESDLARIAFHISLISGQCGEGSTVCDIGGGIGMFSVGCAALGMAATLVDDFGDEINRTTGLAQLPVHETHGVSVLQRNVLDEPLGLPPESFDAITCFSCIEHLHHSPKTLLHESMTILKPGGLFVLSGPNCVNLRKRLTVPLGKGRWSAMAEWYDEEIFRGRPFPKRHSTFGTSFGRPAPQG